MDNKHNQLQKCSRISTTKIIAIIQFPSDWSPQAHSGLQTFSNKLIDLELPGDSEKESRKRLFIKTFEEPERCSIDRVVEPGRVRKWGEYVQSLSGRKIEVSSCPCQLLNQIICRKN